MTLQRSSHGLGAHLARALALGSLWASLWLQGCLARPPLAEGEVDVSERRGALPHRAPSDPHSALRAHLERASAALAALPGYEAQIVKEERIGGRLYAPQRMECKVRHEPFSVYLRFVAPPELAGQEALYAGERYGGRLLARSAGAAGLFGAVALDPQGSLAMRSSRYPITDTGMRRLLDKLVAFVGDGNSLGELRQLEGAEVDGRSCTGFEASPAAGAPFALVRVYFDDAWGLPVAYEALAPGPSGDDLCLLERYTYESVDLGVALGDEDFDRRNPAYDLR